MPLTKNFNKSPDQSLQGIKGINESISLSLFCLCSEQHRLRGNETRLLLQQGCYFFFCKCVFSRLGEKKTRARETLTSVARTIKGWETAHAAAGNLNEAFHHNYKSDLLYSLLMSRMPPPAEESVIISTVISAHTHTHTHTLTYTYSTNKYIRNI